MTGTNKTEFLPNRRRLLAQRTQFGKYIVYMFQIDALFCA